MRKVQRWRYYCDHCKKAGGSAGHMARHERGCTANPARVCGVCAKAGLSSKPLLELIQFVRSKATWHPAYEDGPVYGSIDKVAVDALRELAGDCPVCMLAALRQSNVYAPSEAFDMKAELRKVWSEVNDEQYQRESYAY
jgi:hypothetical protein